MTESRANENLMEELMQEQKQEYVPTMKEKFLKSQAKVPGCMLRHS